MLERLTENNKVRIAGKIVSDFQFSHESFGEGFYICNIAVPRLSDMEDIIPIIVSDRLFDVHADSKGRDVVIIGQFRSYNRHDESNRKLLLSVFVKDIKFAEDAETNEELNEVFDLYAAEKREATTEDSAEGEVIKKKAPSNQIFLDGFICKAPVYRKTPLGREIADLLVAVNRQYGKSDYIPCITWGRNAKFASDIKVGTNIQIVGRVQSREYTKKIDENKTEIRVAYEVSVNQIKRIAENAI
ncbi:single-stranded DNA-binding protein [Lachnospira multipara]|uniref:single-stranded DNA-binding protein n=1 Tax=Lachnospira multipara TaxID=28051 RepID=UPI00047F1CCB|nr:single-stranded DNA-binding protein [Lachnospira multipara]